MRKQTFVMAVVALVLVGLLTVGVCICPAQGFKDSGRAQTAAQKPRTDTPPEAAVAIHQMTEKGPELTKVQREQQRAQLQMELDMLKLDEKVQELSQQKQKLYDQQRREQIQRQLELAGLDDKMQVINLERSRLSAEHRRLDQKAQESQLEIDARIQELNRQKQEMHTQMRRKQLEKQLQWLDAEGTTQK